MKSRKITLGLTLMLIAPLAKAQDGASGEMSAAPEPATSDSSASEPATPGSSASEPATARDSTPATSEAGADGGRFRFGIAGGLGPLTTEGIDMTYYGMDLRFGWQVNDAIGVYAVPQLGYYKLDGVDALFGSGGLLGVSVVGDYTLFDRLFVGAGLGYAILNNPSGTELHLRAGGYPLMSRSDEKVRRRGLMLGVDLRLHFVEGYTFTAPTFNIGYDAF